MKRLIVLLMVFASTLAFANKNTEENKEGVKVKYKESSRIDFESLLIEGERKKPELSVVTGNTDEKDSGLMVFRKDFQDMMANDFGEVIE